MFSRLLRVTVLCRGLNWVRVLPCSEVMCGLLIFESTCAVGIEEIAVIA
jgi:hypothetical protein